MTSSRPVSRPASRAGSFSEAAITVPVDSRVAHAQYHMSGHSTPHDHHRHQDPKLFGPGFSSAPVHGAAESQIRYVLVTPDMLNAIESGQAPHTQLVHPAGTNIRNNAGPTEYSAQLHTLNSSYTRDPPTESTVEKPDRAHLNDANQETAVVAAEDVEGPYLPNPIARLRHAIKEPLGEFIGTMILIIFGNGVNCQVVLSKLTQGSYLSISFGWGIGVMFGVYTCGGISGGHLNPAVTISLAAFRGFPWKKVPGYAIGQLAGAFVGSCLIQSNYRNLITQYEGGAHIRTIGLPTSTATLFFTGAQSYMSNLGAFFSEFFATAVLLGVILALGDANNNPVPAGLNGLILLWLIVGIGAALGTETAYCLNPARDLGPRLAAAVFGYGHEIWTYRNYYFLYVPILATITGALAGCLVYDLFIFTGPESPVNRKWELGFLNRKRPADVQSEDGHSHEMVKA